MKPTRERAVAALRAVLELCDEMEADIPEDAGNAAVNHAGRRIRTAITDALATDPTTNTLPRS